jgi:hypothetical protein
MNKQIDSINSVIEAYFAAHNDVTILPVKELMPELIAAGIFTKDVKNGKPIRDVLKKLQKENTLNQIPFAHPMQNGEDTYWYFVPKDATKPTTLYKQNVVSAEKIELENKRLLSDKYYVINLCDEALNLKAKRQKRFDFLLGDLHRDGKTRTELPVDAFYHDLNLVIEFKEAPLAEPTEFFNKLNVRTVSGISRAKQREKYDRVKAAELPQNGIKLIEIPYTIFTIDESNRIIRNHEQDLKTVTEFLKPEQLQLTGLAEQVQ